MATGGIANVLHSIPYRSNWLEIIGVIFFLLNIVIFIFISMMMTLRFCLNPGSLKQSLANQSECLFLPACIVSIGMAFINTCQYGIPHAGPWLEYTMEIVFWIYGAAGLLTSAGIYLVLWSTQYVKVS